MTTLPPDNLPPTPPDPLESELAALSQWEGPLPTPRPWEEAARQTQGWRLYLHRPLPYVAAAAGILILAVIFAGALPTLRSTRQLKLAKDLADSDESSKNIATLYQTPLEQQLQTRNLQEWKDSQARNDRETNLNVDQFRQGGVGVQHRTDRAGPGAPPRNQTGGAGEAPSVRLKGAPAEMKNEGAPPAPSPAASSGAPPPPAAPAAPGAPAKTDLAPAPAPAAPAPPTGDPKQDTGGKPEGKAGTGDPGRPAAPLMTGGFPATAPAAPELVGMQAAAARMVVERANLELLVPDVRAAVAAITPLVQPGTGEFIEQQAVIGDDRKPQTLTGALVLRINRERMPAVLASVRTLGRITTDTAHGEDVTDRVIDIGATLKNERHIEAELLKTIEERAKGTKLEEVMKARESVAAVRQNIERLTAQNEAMLKQVALATLSISVRHDAVEAPAPAIPTAPDKLRQAANQGSATLTDSVAGIVEFLIGGLVWWVLIGVIVIASVITVRRANRKARGEPPPSV